MKIIRYKVSRPIPRAKVWTNTVISERDVLEIKNLGAYGKEKLVTCYLLFNTHHIKSLYMYYVACILKWLVKFDVKDWTT